MKRALLAMGGLCALTACGTENGTESAEGRALDAPTQAHGSIPDAPAAGGPVQAGPDSAATAPDTEAAASDSAETAPDSEAATPESVETAPAPDAPAEARIEASLARLDALEILDTGALFETHSEHSWVPYGGLWTTHTLPLEPEETATRLEEFVRRAEAAADAVTGAVDQGFADEAGVPSLCYSLTEGTEGAWCLTIDLHAADLAALNALEIVEIEGIVRDQPAQEGMCYSSWSTVTADDCVRAHQVHALVEATRALPTAVPPVGAPERAAEGAGR